MSRITATVLFTDLVGSTELRGRLGEEAAEELRRRHDQLLAGAVEANNGRVVKGLGDGIMATFNGAADAVAAAVAIQQAVDRLNRSGKAAVPLAVRVGLSAGDVAFEDDDVHGTPVIEASRLCGIAGGGEILGADVVRILAGTTGGHNYVSIGPLQLKGLDHPVAAVRVGWEPVVVSSVPMPALLTDIGRIFVGRDAESERLAQLWKEATAGERRVALLAGEPGVGKTRLAAEIAIRVHDEGGVVLAGRCDEDLGVPYQPFVEALRHFVDHTPVGELAERLGRYGGELTRLVPELVELVPDLALPLQSDPETERYRLFDAVAAWLAAVSTAEPVILVLDDLQWAAKPTLLLLRHVVRSSNARRLLILGTYRDVELVHDHPLVELVADLRRQSAVERLSLVGLDDAAVAAIVERAAGHALDEEGLALARVVYQETEGNPFFVREVLRHLAETKAIERHGERWVSVPIDQLGIPEGVRDVIGRRLARLSGEANKGLRVAAVVGAEFEVGIVQAASQLAEDDLLATLEEAVQARLVSEVAPSRFRFSHALVRATLYESVTGTRKAALHRHVAEAIEAIHGEALDDYLPALAHHWATASAVTNPGRAIEYARKAGDRALAQLAHDEAVSYYGSALELLEVAKEASSNEALRLELLIALGEAQRRAGDPAHRETLFGAGALARTLHDGEAMARAALAGSRGTVMSAAGSIDQQQVTFLEDALKTLGDAEPALRARLLATLGLELIWGDSQRRFEASEEALAIARRLDDPGTLAHVLQARFYTVTSPATVEERLANTAELLDVARRLGDPVTACRAYHLRCRIAGEVGAIGEAERCLAAYEEVAAEVGQPALVWVGSWYRTGLTSLRGDLEQAERQAFGILETGRRLGMADAEVFWALHLFPVRFEQGRLAEFDAEFSNFVEGHPLALFQAMLALLHCEAGREEEARTRFRALAADLNTYPVDLTWLKTMTDLAYLAAHLSEADAAHALTVLLAPYVDQVVAVGGTFSGSVSHHLALLYTSLGRHDEAERHFADASSMHEQIIAPTWLARTRVEWARMLLTRRQPGDVEQTRGLLGQALDTARKLGLARIERNAVALLQ